MSDQVPPCFKPWVRAVAQKPFSGRMGQTFAFTRNHGAISNGSGHLRTVDDATANPFIHMDNEELQYAKAIGEQMSALVLCPRMCGGSQEPQELVTFGDNEDRLFCPHCELEVQITVSDL